MKHSVKHISAVLLIVLLVVTSTTGQYAFANPINNGAMANCPMMMDMMGNTQNNKMSGDCCNKDCQCDMSLCSSNFYMPSSTFDRAIYPTVSEYNSIANQNGDHLYIDIPTAPPKQIS